MDYYHVYEHFMGNGKSQARQKPIHVATREEKISFADENVLTHTFQSVGVWVGRYILLQYQGNNSMLNLKKHILLEGFVSLFILLESLENNL